MKDLLPLRNRIAHGIWYTGRTTGDEATRFDEAFVHYTKLSEKEGLVARDVSYTAMQLEALAEEAEDLRILVWQFASGCSNSISLGPQFPRVGDYLALVDGKVEKRDLSTWSPPNAPAQ